MPCGTMMIDDCQDHHGEMALSGHSLYTTDNYAYQPYHNAYENCNVRGNLGPGPLPPSATYVDQANQTRSSDTESEDTQCSEFLDLDNTSNSPGSGNVIFYLDGLPYDIDISTDFNQGVEDLGKLKLTVDDSGISDTVYLIPDNIEQGSPLQHPCIYDKYPQYRYIPLLEPPSPGYNHTTPSDSDGSVCPCQPIIVPKPRATNKKRPPRQRPKVKMLQLWQFLRMILADERYNPHFIVWVNEEEGIFKFVQSKKVAQIWGQRKKRDRMPYEHLSRAMRHYYKRGILRRIECRRLTYQFGPNAEGWREGFTDVRQVPSKTRKSQ